MPVWPSPVRRTLAVLPALLWAGAIFALSAQPSLPSPQVTGLDKVAHAGAFGLLALLVALALRAQGLGRRETAFLAVAISVSYGALDELHQSFVPGRSPDLFDLCADAAGAALAAALWYGAPTGRRREGRTR